MSLLGDPRWQAAISVALVLEYEEVATREALRLGLESWVVESTIDMMCRVASQHTIRFRLRPALPDPDDASRADAESTRLGVVADLCVTSEFLRTIKAWP